MVAQALFTRTDSGELYGKPGLDLLLVETGLCRAVIALQGAQVLEFAAHERAPLLWLSPAAIFQPGTAVRGGVPVCLPWFGLHRTDPSKPKHGLVRSQLWQLSDNAELDDGSIELVFTFVHAGDALFAAAFTCELRMRLGRELSFDLSIHNTSALDAEFSWALHSYFAVEDVREVAVEGLAGGEFLDNTRGLQRDRLDGLQEFPGEIDRVFEQAPAAQRIITADPISAHSEGCDSVITWNPGPELAASLKDVGAHYREFVCVEHGNVFADSWQLAAGTSASARLVLSR